MQFPVRKVIPPDIWWFDTGAATSFLNTVFGVLRDWANDPRPTTINDALQELSDRSRERARKMGHKLTWGELAQHVSNAVRSQEGEYGWNRLEIVARFGHEALQAMAISGSDKELLAAEAIVGSALLLVGLHNTRQDLVATAIGYLTSGAQKVSQSEAGREWIWLHLRCAEALRWLGERRTDREMLFRARALLQAVVAFAASREDTQSHQAAEGELHKVEGALAKWPSSSPTHLN